MSPAAETLALFGGIAAVLAAASLFGVAIERRYAGAAIPPAIANLNARLRAWWVMVALLGVAFALGKAGVIVLFAFASFAGLREFLTLTTTRRGDHWAMAAAFFIVLPAQYYLVWIEWYGLYAIFIPVYVFLLLPVVAALRGDVTQFMARVAELQWGLMIAVYCLSYVPALLTLPIPGFAAKKLLLVAFLVLVVQASDVLQYVCGKIFGRHKIAPRLSKAKTVEGFLGGVLSATLLGAALWRLTPFAPAQAAVMALVITLMGFCGGLVMSALKRDRGIKDWGWMIAGHGGMLDRLDSVIFAAPVFFHLTRYWWTA
jgi:phosphatidate cytidylyltransferase